MNPSCSSDFFSALKGKTAIVTGASSGIGESTAIQLAEHGVRVYAVARRSQRLEALAKSQEGIVPVVQDVTKNLDPLKKAIAGQAIDILVNNAGGALGKDAIQDTSPQKWQGMIDTNLKALIAMTQLVLPDMIKARQGDILNVGSIAGTYAYPGGSVYCAVKAGVQLLTETWQQDLLGKGIRVMAIQPGLVETEFSLVRFEGNTQKANAVYANTTPLTAGDVAQSIVWMLSQPAHVNIPSLTIMPTVQASPTMIFRHNC